MNKLYKLIIILGLILFSPAIFAQSNTKFYSLDECIKMALEHNYELDNARKELKISYNKKLELKTKYFPTLSADVMAYQSNNPLIDDKLNLSMLNIPNIPIKLLKKGYLASLVAVEPIFNGKRIVIANKLAEVGKESSSLLVRKSEKEIKETTEVYFWKIINLKEKRKILESQAKLLKQLHHDVSLAVKVGVINRNDLLRVELQEQRIESGFVTIDHAIELSKLVLMQYIGIMDRGNEFEIENSYFPNIEDPIKYRKLPHEAVYSRVEFALLNKKLLASKLQKKLEFGKYLPQFAVGASLTQFNLLDLSSFMDEDFKAVQRRALVFATLKIPISSWWGGSHALIQKKLAIDKAKNELKNGEELMELEIIQTWNALSEAYDQIQIAKKSILSSKENLRLNKDTYSAGTTTMADLLDAQMLVQESENQLTEAKTNYMIAWAKYRRITME